MTSPYTCNKALGSTRRVVHHSHPLLQSPTCYIFCTHSVFDSEIWYNLVQVQRFSDWSTCGISMKIVLQDVQARAVRAISKLVSFWSNLKTLSLFTVANMYKSHEKCESMYILQNTEVLNIQRFSFFTLRNSW